MGNWTARDCLHGVYLEAHGTSSLLTAGLISLHSCQLGRPYVGLVASYKMLLSPMSLQVPSTSSGPKIRPGPKDHINTRILQYGSKAQEPTVFLARSSFLSMRIQVPTHDTRLGYSFCFRNCLPVALVL